MVGTAADTGIVHIRSFAHRNHVESWEAQLAVQQQRQKDREHQQKALLHELEQRQKIIRQVRSL